MALTHAFPGLPSSSAAPPQTDDAATLILADLVSILRTMPVERTKQHVHEAVSDSAARADYDRLAQNASTDMLALISARAILAEKRRT